MAKPRGGSGKGQGRKSVWERKPESRISVPYELADPRQTKAIAEIWSLLKQQGVDFSDLSHFLENSGVELVLPNGFQHFDNGYRTYRMYSTAVAASFGVISTSDVDTGDYEEVDLNDLLVQVPERTIILKVVGNSMMDEGIKPNSTLIVETTDTINKSWLQVETGNIVIALVDRTYFTVKRFERTSEGEFLVPRNRRKPEYERLQVGGSAQEGEDECRARIIGIVKKVIQDL